MTDEDEETESPCIGVCVLDETRTYCTACGQTLEELMIDD